jgi:hypothetical protein
MLAGTVFEQAGTFPVPEKLWKERELAAYLRISCRTVRRRFENLPGVMLMGDHRGSSRKRRYTIMLVPDSVLRAEMERWSRR